MRPAECTRRVVAFVVVTLAGAANAIPAKALVITSSYDAAWLANAPGGAYTDVNAVINQYDTSLGSNPSFGQANINIQFDWGNIAGSPLPGKALGVTTFPQALGLAPVQFYTFGQVKNLLTTASAAQPLNTALATAVANLPAANPFKSNQFFIPDTQYLALTGRAQNSDTINAYVGVGTNPGAGWNFSGGTPLPGQFDFTSVLEHEVAHALGRVDFAFASGKPGGAPPFLTPLDLFKYDAGTSKLDPNFNNTVYSIDRDRTPLQVFNNTSDSSDWRNTAFDTQDSYVAALNPGTFALVSPTGFTMMKSLGWDPLPNASHQISGFTVAPNWAFGSPQTPIVTLCTTIGASTCRGHFGLGPLDSVFDFFLPSAGRTTEASFAAIQEATALRLLEAGDTGAGDFWNLTIPNAVWLRSASYNLLIPNQPPGTVADSISFANIGGLAHILWANGTDPDGSILLPSGYLDELLSLGLTPTDVTALTGPFGNSDIPPPSLEECLGNFPTSICDQTLAGSPLPTVPEPSSACVLLAALLGIAGSSRGLPRLWSRQERNRAWLHLGDQWSAIRSRHRSL